MSVFYFEGDANDNIYSVCLCHSNVLFLKGDAQAGLVSHWFHMS